MKSWEFSFLLSEEGANQLKKLNKNFLLYEKKRDSWRKKLIILEEL